MSDLIVIEMGWQAADGTPTVRRAGRVSDEGAWLQAVNTDALAGEAGQDAVIVVDGTLVASHAQAVPDFPDAKLLKILPGLMDDKLSVSGDARHLALMGARDAEAGTRPVAVMDFEIIAGLLGHAKAMGLHVAALVPDYALVPVPQEGMAAIARDGHVMARRADGTGFTLEADVAAHLLAGTVPEACGDAAWRQVLASAAGTDVNLMQGAFGARGTVASSLVWFRRAGLLAAASLVLWVAGAALEASNNYAEADRLHAEAEQLFREALPDVPRIVNMTAQMRRALMDRRQEDGGEFLTLSDRIFRAVAADGSTMLESLRYDAEAGTLVVNVSFASFAEGETFKGALLRDGLRVTEGGSRREGARVVAELTVGRAA